MMLRKTKPKAVFDIGERFFATMIAERDRGTERARLFDIAFKNALRPAAARGDSRTAEYRCWSGMKARCLNPNASGFKYYGGRGITICDRWLESYKNFLLDMGRKPTPAHSIDRIDVNGNYEPANCRWATATVQNSNRRNSPAYRE